MLFAGILTAASAEARSISRVLVLQSYNSDFQWTRDINAALRDTLASEADHLVQLRYEYLDTKYARSDAYLQQRATTFAAKYADVVLDGIVAVDNAALEFLVRHRNRLFGPVPTVFAGINGYRSEMTEGLQNVTGVVEALSFEQTLNRIPQMIGDVHRLYFLTADTLTARRNLELAREYLDQIEWEPEVITVVDPDPADLERISRAEVQGSAAALLIGSVLDHAGRRMDFGDAARLIPTYLSSIPIFTLWDFYLGYGMVGGCVTYGTHQGTAAGELMLQVLSGAPADSLPVITESPNSWVLDVDALRRFGISRRVAPADAVFINYEPGLWHLFRTELVLAGLTMLALVAGVVSLLIVSRVRRETSAHLAESLEEKKILLREIHHRVKNNLQVISSILNMQGDYLQDPQALAYFLDCDSRVRSMALVHEQLYQSTSLARIGMDTYVRDLVDTVAQLMAPRHAVIHTDYDLGSISLDLDAAIPAGLLINELVSNAFKYGVSDGDPDGATTGAGEAAPAGDAAGLTTSAEVRHEVRHSEIHTNRVRRLDLRVAMSIDPETAARVGQERVLLEVTDRGPGLQGTTASKGSLGLKLVEALTEQLEGQLTMQDCHPGLQVRVSFPLHRKASSSRRLRNPATPHPV